MTDHFTTEERTMHTPGPWFARSESYPFLVRDSRGNKVAHAGAARSDAECMANARLIAAAPELLALVKKSRRSHYECEDCWYSCATLTCDEHRKGPCDCGADEWNAAIDAVIAKAEGLSHD